MFCYHSLWSTLSHPPPSGPLFKPARVCVWTISDYKLQICFYGHLRHFLMAAAFV